MDNIENMGVDFSKKDYIKIFLFLMKNKTIEIYKSRAGKIMLFLIFITVTIIFKI